eukprot:tig00021293_g20013.t1
MERERERVLLVVEGTGNPGTYPTIAAAWGAAKSIGAVSDLEVYIVVRENAARPPASPAARLPSSPARSLAMSPKRPPGSPLLHSPAPSSPGAGSPKRGGAKGGAGAAWEGPTYLDLGEGARLTVVGAGPGVTLRAGGGTGTALSCAGRSSTVLFRNLRVEGKVYLDGRQCEWRFEEVTIDGRQASGPGAALAAAGPGRDGSLLRVTGCRLLGRARGAGTGLAGLAFAARGGMLLCSESALDGFDTGLDVAGPCTLEARPRPAPPLFPGPRATRGGGGAGDGDEGGAVRGPAMRLRAPVTGRVEACDLLGNPGGGVRFVDAAGLACAPFLEVLASPTCPSVPPSEEVAPGEGPGLHLQGAPLARPPGDAPHSPRPYEEVAVPLLAAPPHRLAAAAAASAGLPEGRSEAAAIAEQCAALASSLGRRA